MVNIVNDGDVLSEKLLTHALVEAGALVFESGGSKIGKEKADEVEDRSRFEDHRVTTRVKLARVDGKVGLFAGAHGKFLRIECADIREVGFSPACSGSFLHGDGEFRVRLAIGGKKAAGIPQSGVALAIGINSSGDLTFLDCEVTRAADGAGALFSRK